MSSTTPHKIAYIIARYNFEKERLNNAQKMHLLNTWINTLTEFEEYEMASALLSQKIQLIRSLSVRKKKQRSILRVLRLRLRILIRKFRKSL